MLGDTSPGRGPGVLVVDWGRFSVRFLLGHDRLDPLEIPEDFGAPPFDFRD